MKFSLSCCFVIMLVVGAYGRGTLDRLGGNDGMILRQRRSPLILDKGLNVAKGIGSKLIPGFGGNKKPEGGQDTATQKPDETATQKLDKDGYPNPDPEIVRPDTFTAKPEKGHFSGFARDGLVKLSQVVTKGVTRVGKAFSRNTGGLDTEPSFFSKLSSPFTGAAKSVTNEFMSHVNSIYPGTKWCGGGNVSDTDESLGLFPETDKCCREHDKCPDNMEANEVRNGLHNKGLFTRSHCSCDTKFYDCLKKNMLSPISSSIGVTYFNIIGPQCYREDYPIQTCKNWVMTASNLTKCTEYEFDKNSAPVYQWFDNKLFYGLPELNIA